MSPASLALAACIGFFDEDGFTVQLDADWCCPSVARAACPVEDWFDVMMEFGDWLEAEGFRFSTVTYFAETGEIAFAGIAN